MIDKPRRTATNDWPWTPDLKFIVVQGLNERQEEEGGGKI